MDRHLRSQPPRAAQGSSQASASSSSSSQQLPYHSAALKRLGKQPVRSTVSTASSSQVSLVPASSPPPESPIGLSGLSGVASASASSLDLSRLPYNLPHAYPDAEDESNVGLRFDIDWNNVYKYHQHLPGDALGYRVVNKRQLLGGAARSPIYDHGADLVFRDASAGGKERRVWLCKYCHEMKKRDCAKFSESTHYITKHLEKAHFISATGGLVAGPAVVTPFDAARGAISVPGADSVLSKAPWQEEELQRAYVDWVITNDMSFAEATSPATRALLTWNRRSLLAALPANPTTLAAYVTNMLEERTEEVASLLRGAESLVHVSVDIWTSSNYLSFLGVTAHFVDAQKVHQDILIAFRNLSGDHTGENQGAVVAAVVLEYGFQDKFGCFVGDNATNNDATFINALNVLLKLELTAENRIRCAGHIINLIVKAIIYGDGVSQFERDLADAPPKSQFAIFRRRGIVGRLHNLVVAINASNKRRHTFQQMQREDVGELLRFTPLTLVVDGEVRWHSVYLMLVRGYELKESIDRFIRRWRQSKGVVNNAEDEEDEDGFNPALDCLTPDEWDQAKSLADMLQPFYEMTKRLEGNTSKSGFGSIWQTITNLNVLDLTIREEKRTLENSHDEFLKGGINQGFEKLNTYWLRIIFDVRPSPYAVATVLAPRLRIAWFKQRWRHDNKYYRKVESDMKATFELYVERFSEQPLQGGDERLETEPPSRRKTPDGYASRYEDSLAVDTHYMMGYKHKAKKARMSELDDYYATHNEHLAVFANTNDKRLDNPITWWEQVGFKLYPTLYRMALDYLSIPATSCDCERAFSGAGRTVTGDRNCLQGGNIEALQLQKNWVKRGAVQSHLNNLVRSAIR